MINIMEKNECTGCYGCATICPQNCIYMLDDNEGFKYPKVDLDKCIKCNLCERVCPLLNIKYIDNNPIALACYNINDDVRKQSSSGGIFSLVAERVINNNGVVFGAKFDKNFEVKHDYAETIKGIDKFRGAKYVQSRIGDTYRIAKQFLNQGRQVLFSGTPCQIGGLKRYLQKEYSNLICIDLICHGVPSPLAWKTYKERFNNKKEIKNINFRDKTYGWKGYSFRIDYVDKSNELIRRLENSYMDGFIGDIYLRPSCHECKFKSINRESDLTLADFWGIDNIIKDMNDDKGTSLILVNSEIGRIIVNDIYDSIKMVEVDINEAIKYNISAIKSSYCNPKREYFFKRINKVKFDKLVSRSLTEPINIRIKVKLAKLIKK